MQFLSRLEFLMVHGYWPDLHHPQSFSEKIWNRMLFDRDPRFIRISDKFQMRSYISEKVGDEYLVPLLWSGNDPDHIQFEELPLKFVMKATHGCGYNLIVPDRNQLDPGKARLQLKKWLRTNYGETFGLGTEWCHKYIRPAIVIEEYLEEEDRCAPDYKFWCFSGRVECMTVHLDRFRNHVTQTFDRDFKPYRYPIYLYDSSRTIHPPRNFEQMVLAAESLTSGFDFLRVDMYNIHGRILVGEFAVYPGGGFVPFMPREFDIALGSRWTGSRQIGRL